MQLPRAQQPVQVGGRPQRLAPLTGIGTGPQRAHGPFGVVDQAGQEDLGFGEPCGRGLPDLPRLLHPVPRLVRGCGAEGGVLPLQQRLHHGRAAGHGRLGLGRWGVIVAQ